MEDVESIVKNPSAWVPQLYFDLIARVIPGVFLLVLFLFETKRDLMVSLVLGQPKGLGFAESFLSLSILLVVGLFASYVISVILWGIFHSIVEVVKTLCKLNFDTETFVPMDQKELAKKYETIKKRPTQMAKAELQN